MICETIKLSPPSNGLDVKTHFRQEEVGIVSSPARDISINESRYVTRNENSFPLLGSVEVDVQKPDGNSIGFGDASDPHVRNEIGRPHGSDCCSLAEEETAGGIAAFSERSTEGQVKNKEELVSSFAASNALPKLVDVCDGRVRRTSYSDDVSRIDSCRDKHHPPNELVHRPPFSVDIQYEFDKKPPVVRVVSTVTPFSSAGDNVVTGDTSRPASDWFMSVGESVDLSGLSLKVNSS
jgi:hypothetical protein